VKYNPDTFLTGSMRFRHLYVTTIISLDCPMQCDFPVHNYLPNLQWNKTEQVAVGKLLPFFK